MVGGGNRQRGRIPAGGDRISHRATAAQMTADRFMSRVVRAQLLWICLTLAVMPSPALAADVPDARVLDGIVKDSLRAWEVPGAAVVVVLDDRVVYLKGFGVKQQGGKD